MHGGVLSAIIELRCRRRRRRAPFDYVKSTSDFHATVSAFYNTPRCALSENDLLCARARALTGF